MCKENAELWIPVGHDWEVEDVQEVLEEVWRYRWAVGAFLRTTAWGRTRVNPTDTY